VTVFSFSLACLQAVMTAKMPQNMVAASIHRFICLIFLNIKIYPFVKGDSVDFVFTKVMNFLQQAPLMRVFHQFFACFKTILQLLR
jgi:hypothetical protein